MQKKPGRPKEIDVRRPKLIRLYASVLPSLKDEIDQAVAANGKRSDWIADAIKQKLNRLKKANRKS